MSEPLLSVILPNHNHGPYLRRAIEAIVRQDRPPDEIIVVDDASTDDSRAILRDLERTNTGIRVLLNSENLGVIASLQKGLSQASGRYIYFAAADDWILPGFFNEALYMLEASPLTGIFCAETVIVDGETGHHIGMRPPVRPAGRRVCLSPAAVERLLRRADNFIHTGSSVLRRKTILEKGGLCAAAGSFADGLLCRKVALGTGLCFLPRPVATWQIYADGVSRTTASDPLKARQALADIPKIIADDPDFPVWYPPVFARRWRFAVCRLALQRRPADSEILLAMNDEDPLDRALIQHALAFRSWPGFRFVMLAWLATRLRPFRLRDLFRTAITRHISGMSTSR